MSSTTTELALLPVVTARCGHWPTCEHNARGLTESEAHQQLDAHYRQHHHGQPHPHPGLAAWRRQRGTRS